ncbi:protein kinase domain-containing protein [Jatrophihabitans fulvus]
MSARGATGAARRGDRAAVVPVGWSAADPLPESDDTSPAAVLRLRVTGPDGRPGLLFTVVGSLDGRAGKDLRRRLRGDQPELDRMLREVCATADGATLLPWLEYGDPRAPRPYVVCERPGPSLSDRLLRGPLPVAQVVSAALVGAAALDELRRHGHAHGLISPQSLIDEPGGRVRLVAPLPAALADIVALAGGTGHEPPEVLRGGGTTWAADVFSLASTAWTLLTGRPPFGAPDDRLARLTAAEPPPLVRADVPPALADTLRAALAADPGRRPELATLTHALRIVADGSSPVAAPPRATARILEPGAPRADAPETTRVPVRPEMRSDGADARQDTLAPTRPVGDSGRPLGSRYLLDALIGRGATGHVWRGHERDTGRPVAVKLLRSELAEDPEVVTRFMRERAALMRLSHPHLVAVHDLVAEGGALAIVMDLVPGKDLRAELAGGPLDPRDAGRLLAGTAAALAAVHDAGIVHRDLKPENVIVEPHAGSTRARLTDFGLARAVESSALTRVTQLVGTPAYVAPEVVAGRTPGPAVDVYALGVTAYEVLTGRRPFAAPSTAALLRAHLDEPPSRPEGMSDELWAIVAACLQKDPARRPSAADLAAAWRQVADGAPAALPSRPAGQPTPAPVPVADDDRVPSWPEPDGSGVRTDSALLTGSGVQYTTASARPLDDAPPAAPAPRRKRTKLWLAAAAVVVLGFGGGFGYVLLTKDKDARPTNDPYPLRVKVSADRTISWSVPESVKAEQTVVIVQVRHDGGYRQLPAITDLGQTTFRDGTLQPNDCVQVSAWYPKIAPPKDAGQPEDCFTPPKKSSPSSSSRSTSP